VLIFITHVRPFHTELLLCIPLGALRCSGACAVLIFSFHSCPWLFLACSWLLLAAPDCLRLLIAASGCSWLSLAVVDVISNSKENDLFEISRCGH
jgi:hypothetical protein